MEMHGNEIIAQLLLVRNGFTLDVNLRLPGQGVTALFGPSGCGKTTCLRAVAGLDRARPGHVSVNGQIWQDDAQRVWTPTHRRALGYVFQEPSLFDHLTVQGNIGYGLQRTPAARRKVTLNDVVDLLGLGGLMARRPQSLSGGERQRVAIARALAASPRLLLMDEPLSALDAQRKAEVLPYLEALHRSLDIPILYVSHSVDEVVRLADHMVLMDAGRVRAHGATRDLLTQLDLPLAHGDTAATLVEGTVTRHDALDHVTTVDFGSGELLLVSAVPHLPGQRLRLRLQARDVSLTLAAPVGTSILNVLPATVAAVTEDSPGQWMVALELGQVRVLARITQRSALALGVAPGKSLFAQIKGIAVVS